MTGNLHTPAEAAEILKVRESWLRAKAAARAIPCTFVGKHLRFSDDDLAEIMTSGARRPVISPERIRRGRRSLATPQVLVQDPVVPAPAIPPQPGRPPPAVHERHGRPEEHMDGQALQSIC